MSSFTTQIRWYIEAGNTLPLNDYPIFDETYRAGLNKKIIDHYEFREIGAETMGLFNKFLKRKMNEIMPYYNQRYKSTLLEFEPLKTYNFTETIIGNTKSQYNDTPMGELDDIFSEEYATDTTQANQTSTRNLCGKNDSKSYSELLEEFRSSMVNIDMEVIRELEVLFMGLWEAEG